MQQPDVLALHDSRPLPPCVWWSGSAIRAGVRVHAAQPGFLVVDRLAEQHGIRVSRKESRALVGAGEMDGRPVVLAKPQTFMNLSGSSVRPLLEKHRPEPRGTWSWSTTTWICPGLSLRIGPKGSPAGTTGWSR